MGGTFKDLRVWQESMALARSIYRVTETWPKSERYELGRQMRRAAVSVPSNIAEGKGRRTDKDCLQFLHTARGSLYELETQVLLARDLQYLQEGAATALLKEVQTVAGSLTGLIRALAGVTA